jgi:alpha-beta hydrolase superfamily lysophospholipase
VSRYVDHLKRRLTVSIGWAILVLGLLAGGIGCWSLGSELIRPQLHTVPLPAGFDAQPVSIPGSDHTIAGWWIDSDSAAPIVLLLHGIRADRSSMVSRARLLHAHGFSVMLVDLQGHGETPGEAITLGWRESKDVEAAISYMRSRFPERPIGAIGTSLGGASILLAHQPIGLNAVVLEAVYPRIGRAVENRVRMRVGPLAPMLAPLLLIQIPLRLHISTGELEPIRHIATIDAPVLIVAGSRDEHTTLGESEDLYRAAAPPKALWVVQGAQHQDFLAYDAIGYQEHVVHFLEAHLKHAHSATSPH